MGKTTSRQLQAEETRLKIFEAATALFSENTYEQVKISDICRRANVSIGNFYYYFKAKEDIINEGYRDFDIYIRDRWDEYAKVSTSESILFLIRHQLFKISENGSMYATHFFKNQLSNKNKYILDKNRCFYQTLLEVVTEGLKKGDFPAAPSAEEITDSILRHSRGTIYDWCLHEGSYDVIEQGIADITNLLKSFGLK